MQFYMYNVTSTSSGSEATPKPVMCQQDGLDKMQGKLLTSSSTDASALSCSLPLPLAIFCASEIWLLTDCGRVSSARPAHVRLVRHSPRR